jgi:iron complex transport system permease protein
VILLSIAAGGEWVNPMAATGMDAVIVWDIRLPRALTAFAVGGLLALAGSWFQVMLGNPLAEPYVLGVAGSSAVGAVIGLVIWPQTPFVMSLGAFAGACAGISAVMAFSHLGANRLLLAGVVLAAFWAACLALLIALMPQSHIGFAMGWMMGNVAESVLPVWLLTLCWIIALLAGLVLSHSLDLMLLGEKHALALGVDVRRLRRWLLVLASGVTAIAVTAAGTIGFVGLVVPHLMRLFTGSLHRTLLPACAVGGGILLVLADTAARTVIAPAELPVGVLTAMIGVPVFLWLLVRRN